jgi:5-methylcytosine-specific restriction endonuclease McrA
MARSRSQRARDSSEYRRNQALLLADEPEQCMLCFGKYGPLLYKSDLPDMERWWLHPLAATADHIVLVSEGGSHALSNLRPAHRKCNSKRNRVLTTPELPRRVRDFGRPRLSPYKRDASTAPPFL